MSHLVPAQEPVPLEDLLSIIATHPDIDLRCRAVVQLSSVLPNPQVKRRIALSNVGDRDAILRGIAMLLMQNATCAVSCRWEVLMAIGELCRREDREKTTTQTSREADKGADGWAAAVELINSSSKICAQSFVSLPWFVGAMKDLVLAGRAEEDQMTPMAQCALLAEDVLKALPRVVEAPASEESSSDKKNGEEAADDSKPPATKTTFVFSKDAKEAAKDLIFLDRKYGKLDYAPWITRSRRDQCANCGKMKEKDAPKNFDRCSQCKAVFYCGADCQKAHWKAAHRAPCTTVKKALTEGSFSKVDGSAAAFGALYYENRAFAYLTRGQSLRDLDFEEYCMKYTAY